VKSRLPSIIPYDLSIKDHLILENTTLEEEIKNTSDSKNKYKIFLSTVIAICALAFMLFLCHRLVTNTTEKIKLNEQIWETLINFKEYSIKEFNDRIPGVKRGFFYIGSNLSQIYNFLSTNFFKIFNVTNNFFNEIKTKVNGFTQIFYNDFSTEKNIFSIKNYFWKVDELSLLIENLKTFSQNLKRSKDFGALNEISIYDNNVEFLFDRLDKVVQKNLEVFTKFQQNIKFNDISDIKPFQSINHSFNEEYTGGQMLIFDLNFSSHKILFTQNFDHDIQPPFDSPIGICEIDVIKFWLDY